MSKKKTNLNYIPASAKTAAQKKEEAVQSKRANLSSAERAKLLKKRAWTLSVLSLSIVLVMTLSILFASYVPTLYSEKTNSTPESTAVSGIIANEEFNLSNLLYNGEVSDVLQHPYIPANWALTDKSFSKSVAGVVSRDADDSDKVSTDLKAAGIADADVDDILAIESGESSTADKNVLLMYNKTATDMRAYSNSFTVAPNSYLEIKVKVRANVTSGDGAFVSLKTSASDSKTPELAFTGITHNEWKEYTFYVEGSKTSAKTLYLFVGLGTSSNAVKGWAEFDYAVAEQAKKVDYIETVKGTVDETVIKTKSYVGNAKDENLFESRFGSSAVMTGGTAHVGEITDEYELPFYDKDNLEVYKVANPAGGNASEFMTLTNKLAISQSAASSYYRLSFWAKTSDIQLESGAYFYARLYKEDGSTEYKAIELVSTSEEDDDLNSGWEEFSFLFKPDNNTSYQAEIVFSLGALVYGADGYKPAISETECTGNLYVTEFELKEIYPSEYNSASSSNLVKVALASSTSTGLITNGSFNSPVANALGSGSITAHDPNGWDILVPRTSTDAGYVYVPHAMSDVQFGIVSKQMAGTSMPDYFGHTGDDNILAVNVVTPTAIGFASNKFTLAANNQYVISVLVKTSAGAKANVYLTGDVEQSFEVGAIDADKYFVLREFENGGYTKYNFVIKIGDVAKQVALELWVGDKNATYANNAWTGLSPAGSMVAFDEACADTITAEQFDEIVASKEGDADVFEKSETEDFIKDEEGNATEDKEVVEVEYSTTKQNVWVRDFTFVDETGAIQSDDETTETPEEEVVAPIDWLLFSSLILSVAVIIFLIAMIYRKFKRVEKQQVEVVEDPDYKK